jgi:hypothetical protein
MLDACETCPQRKVHEVQYRMLAENLGELKERVRQLETTLARGVLLLVANLAGMVVSLAREFMAS